jgi:ElaB/YqjD/DUF883 family membrane-anchored ribosome-binding protein
MSNQTVKDVKEDVGEFEGPSGSSTKEQSSTQKIHYALTLLDEVAKEKKAEINQLIREKYSNIQEIMDEAKNTYREVVEKTKQNLSGAIMGGEEKIKEISTGIDKTVHENPWLFLVAFVTGGFLFGYILGGSKRFEMQYRV